jgi:hypothetical protein
MESTITFLIVFDGGKLWVLWVFITESLVSFEGNSVSAYFDKLLEANTVGVRDIIPLFQVLLGFLPNASKLFSAPSESHVILECTFVYIFAPVTHTNPTYKGSCES